MRRVRRLRERPGDVLILAFFWINLLFITYGFGAEQLLIENPWSFEYPVWPPSWAVDAIHHWGNTADPLVMVRPAWWRAIIWIDVLVSGPYYATAIYAFTRGREWIRIPSIMYGSMMLTTCSIVMFEELRGPNASPEPLWVAGVTAPYMLAALYLIIRMAIRDDPFTHWVYER